MSYFLSKLNGHSHDEIDTTHLIHELHSIGQENPSARLNLVTLEQLTPSILPYFLFQLQCLEYVPLLFGDFRAVGCPIINSTKITTCRSASLGAW
jgi:hypothetical protein